MVEGSTVTTREVEAHTVEVFHDGHREVFEVCERHDGSWMVVCTTHESEELIARTFPGPRVPAWHVGELVGLPLVDEFADKIAAALTEAMGGAK